MASNELMIAQKKMTDLRGTGSLPKVDGSPRGEKSEVVEESKHCAAGLMNGRYHCPPILGQVPQRLHHKVSCSTT